MKLMSLIATIKKPSSLAPSIAGGPSFLQQLMQFHSRPQLYKRGGAFHPSSLHEACPRQLALNLLYAPVTPTPQDPKLHMIFEVGHALHDRLQKTLLKIALEVGWEFNPEVPIPKECNPWFIEGHCDGVMVHSGIKDGLEIKTINKDGFMRLWDKPHEAHIHQANLYTGLLKLHRMTILYICKDNSWLKEYVLVFDEEMFREDIMKLEAILVCLQQGLWPSRIKPDCHDPQCVYRDACWDEATMDKLIHHETPHLRAIQRFKPVYLRHVA